MRPTLFALPFLFLVPSSIQRAAPIPGGRIEARGVCDVRPEAIACWDMDGVPSSELTNSMRSALSGGSEASFRLGKKNRYLVVRRPQNSYLTYRVNGNPNVYSSLGIGDDPRTEFLHVFGEPADSSTTLQATITVQASTDESLPLRMGTRATVDGWNVEIGAAREIEEDKGATINTSRFYNGNAPVGQQWTLVLGLTGGAGEYVNWAYTPLDASGAPIRYVDAHGRPLTPVRALELEPTLQPANSYRGYPSGLPSGRKPRASAAFFQGNGPAPAFRATTNVDPKWIATLRIRPSHQETITLGPFPLDPR